MYRVYYTEPESIAAHAVDIEDLTKALEYTQSLHNSGMHYVSMVSDYSNMVGKPGVRGAGSEYVPQMLT